MKIAYDVYDFPSKDIDSIAVILENLLGIKPARIGSRLKFGPLIGPSFSLMLNCAPEWYDYSPGNPDDCEIPEWYDPLPGNPDDCEIPEYKHLGTLLFVNETSQPEEIRRLLESIPDLGAVVIRHNERDG